MERTLILAALCAALLAGCGADGPLISEKPRVDETSGTQDGADSGMDKTDSGSADANAPDADTPDSGNEDAASKPDTGEVDAGTMVPNEFTHPQFGTLVTAPSGARVRPWSIPVWSRDAITSVKFVIPASAGTGDTEYTLLVYEKQPAERFETWMARAEVGDAYLSDQTIQTASGQTGYVYTTNDLGEAPDVHITVNGTRFIYYFHAEVSEKRVPQEFVRFVEESRVQ